MVNQSDLAFRLLCKELGADAAYTQMWHAATFHSDKSYGASVVDWVGSSPPSPLLDTKVVVQLAGNDPQQLVAMAQSLQDHSSVVAVDLNLGCPQKCAKRGNYGSHLLQTDPTRVCRILSECLPLCTSLSLSLTLSLSLSLSHSLSLSLSFSLFLSLSLSLSLSLFLSLSLSYTPIRTHTNLSLTHSPPLGQEGWRCQGLQDH
eukprot:GSChrysophyteH2.ASY1.ANO1.937.1 assembled CDS